MTHQWTKKELADLLDDLDKNREIINDGIPRCDNCNEPLSDKIVARGGGICLGCRVDLGIDND